MEGRSGLYRSSKDSMIGGVAGGLAEYFRIDPTLIRILFILMVLVGGSGVLFYIILWIVLPTDEHVIFPNNNPNPMEEKNSQENNQKKQFNPDEKRYKKKDEGSLIAGLILIALGIIFLVIRYFPRIDFGIFGR
ncbi:MAG: PspC domain-containing protein [Bacteroidales bacterium]|nr:PspC domain-containing protein [Bacteroidales bacterium]